MQKFSKETRVVREFCFGCFADPSKDARSTFQAFARQQSSQPIIHQPSWAACIRQLFLSGFWVILRRRNFLIIAKFIIERVVVILRVVFRTVFEFYVANFLNLADVFLILLAEFIGQNFSLPSAVWEDMTLSLSEVYRSEVAWKFPNLKIDGNFNFQ